MAESESENVKGHETQSENVKGHETLWQMKGRYSEEKYRVLLESAHVGIFQSTLEGRYLYANQTFLKLLEYESFAELEKKNSSIHYTDPSARKALIAKIRRSKILSQIFH